MNPGRTVPPPGANPEPTTRQFISDLTVQILADAYGYTVELPSNVNTAHATVDRDSGVLLVQGRTGGLNDTITIDTVGNDIVVEVNDTTETIATNLVQRIVIAGNGGTDTIDHSGVTLPVELVHYVVSSNEDSAVAGTLGDGIVDVDGVVPGAQVPLRAAIRDANAAGGARGIYVPRGNYLLELGGNDDTALAGDLDITGEVTIVGAGAGATIIDAGGSTGIGDRVFEVISTGSLDLARVTLTGGLTPNRGGAIAVNNNPSGGVTELALRDAVVVGNTASNSASNGFGGGIYVAPHASILVQRSVITDNLAERNAGGGGILANGSVDGFASVTLEESIVANNSSGNGVAPDLRSVGATAGKFYSNGGNMITSTNLATFPAGLQLSDYYDQPVDYVVTGLADTYDDTDNDVVMSIRDAIHQANITSGTEEIWLPAWNFVLTIDRGTNPTDTSVAYGDLDITESLVIRGSEIVDATTVGWRPGVVDKVFEKLGDYNSDGGVNIADWIIWRNSLGSTSPGPADGDDDGDVDDDDLGVWGSHLNTTLDLFNVTVVT